jgi:hypothetical protein
METTLTIPRNILSLISIAFFLFHSTCFSLSFLHSRLCITFTHSWPCLGSMGRGRDDLSHFKIKCPFLEDIHLSSLRLPSPCPLPLPNPPQARAVSHLCPLHGHVVWSDLNSKEILWDILLAQSRIWPHLHIYPWSSQQSHHPTPPRLHPSFPFHPQTLFHLRRSSLLNWRSSLLNWNSLISTSLRAQIFLLLLD